MGTANAHPIQRSFFIKYYSIAFAILPGLAGGLARELIDKNSTGDGHFIIMITKEGYKRLREIQKPNRDSNQCFVAMWFTEEMNKVYEDAIKPAIEYPKNEPRFKALKMDNKEHNNDINDEIIAEIRRSRFLVCDLTGYRGGIYFEAGFAYGLGLEVIYTCRKDWIHDSSLYESKDKENPKEMLFDENDHEIFIKKNGIHFDLNHRNRIEWESDKLGDFEEKLKNRIRAVII